MTDDARSSHHSDYQEGLRDGQIKALRDTVNDHGIRLDRHEGRLTAQERITYALLGAIALMEILPTIKEAIGG